jgi:AraC family L-rhamnose operon regulatory protein RhaS
MGDNGIWAFESRHAETFAMDVTEHPFLKLLWIREGAATIQHGSDSLNCESGDLVIVPASTRHRIVDSASQPVSLYGLGIDPTRLPCIASVLSVFQLATHSEPLHRGLHVEQHLRKILYLVDQTDPRSQLSAVATTISLIAELALLLAPPERTANATLPSRGADSQPVDPMLESYVDWLHRNFYEPLTLDAAATASGMSRRTFTNQFKARTGRTWLEYVNALRIERAQELLRETDRKVTSIAFQCGFEDLSTFYRAFKRITGKTPSNS